MFMGAINAFSDEAGKGIDVLTAKNQPIAIARHYKAQGVKWVAVGGNNYGEGSAGTLRCVRAPAWKRRGHRAALLGSTVQPVKKQGLLALQPSKATDYDRSADDRLSLVSLRGWHRQAW